MRTVGRNQLGFYSRQRGSSLLSVCVRLAFLALGPGREWGRREIKQRGSRRGFHRDPSRLKIHWARRAGRAARAK